MSNCNKRMGKMKSRLPKKEVKTATIQVRVSKPTLDVLRKNDINVPVVVREALAKAARELA